MRRRALSGLLGLAGFLLMVIAAPAWALEAVLPVAHGQDVHTGTVGPDAAGVRLEQFVPGAEITDRALPRYAKRVEAAASYDGFDVPGPHLLIERVQIEGALDIGTALPVVLRHVIVIAKREAPWHVLQRPGAGRLFVLWSDIGGAMRTRSASPHVGVALAVRGDGTTIHRSRVGAAADGVQIAGKDVRITECRIDALISREGDHNDAVQIFDGAERIVIARSHIENRHPQTSAVTILGKDVSLQSNLIFGGGWTLYGGAKRNGKGEPGATQVRVTGNVFSRTLNRKVGKFGPVTYWAEPEGSGNVWDDNRYESGVPVVP